MIVVLAVSQFYLKSQKMGFYDGRTSRSLYLEMEGSGVLRWQDYQCFVHTQALVVL